MTMTKRRTVPIVDFSQSFKRRRISNLTPERDRHDRELTTNSSFEAIPDRPYGRFVSSSFRRCDTNDPKYTPSQNNILTCDDVRLKDDDPLVARSRMMEALAKYHDILAHEQKSKDGLKRQSGASNFSCSRAAARKLLEQERWARVPKQLGHIQGVEIGDKFRDRAELQLVGLHHRAIDGIDYMEIQGERLATSIVDSGRYENCKYDRSSGTLIYTGQGGNPAIGGMRPVDQKIERGNRALINSSIKGSPVRVIYGVDIAKCDNHFGLSGEKLTNKIYVYDGLYTVIRYWSERGKYGKLVLKFLLQRMSGQRENREMLSGKFRRGKAAARRTVVSVNDLSNGKEKVPIRLRRSLHDDNLPRFEYITKVIYPKPMIRTVDHRYSECNESEICPCSAKNSGAMPYNLKGQLDEAKSVIYECGPLCKCPPSCGNRVTQNGISFRLEVFWCHPMTRWAVRPRDYIPKGSFVCEYIGEIVHDKEAAKRIENSYMCRAGGAKILSCSLGNRLGDITIDATLHGNVGRFVNHSDSPNLRAQCVLYDHADVKMPHVMLFAAKDIPPQHELTVDYAHTTVKFGMVRNLIR